MASKKRKCLKARPTEFHLYRDDDVGPVIVLWFGNGCLYRVQHDVRHSPTGMEWGYGGSGPADCARSMLLALERYCFLPRIEQVYQQFKWTFLSGLPERGGTIRVDKVLTWYARFVNETLGGEIRGLDELWLSEERVNGKEAV